jgi:hypothetical protein
MKALWLLENHKAHQSSAKLLAAQLQYQCNKATYESDAIEAIEGMALARNPITGVPSAPSLQSKTEKIALSYCERMAHEKEAAVREIRSHIEQVNYHLQLYDAVMEGLTDKEKWLVESHYIQQLSYSDMLRTIPDGLRCTSKTGLYNKTRSILKKMDDFLTTVTM